MSEPKIETVEEYKRFVKNCAIALSQAIDDGKNYRLWDGIQEVKKRLTIKATASEAALYEALGSAQRELEEEQQLTRLLMKRIEKGM